jgi:hypothetical protein
VWSGLNVIGNSLTTPYPGAPYPGTPYTVTATIFNGASEWGASYTQNFTITAYDPGSSGSNPFGDNTTPFYWAMDGKGGTVYVKIWGSGSPWEAVGGNKDGTYSWDTGKNVATWTVTGGGSIDNTGLAVIDDTGKMLVANLVNQYSDMNGTFTKLNTSLTLADGTGIWKSDSGMPPYNDFLKIVATGGNSGTFVGSISDDGVTGWSEKVKGMYSPLPGESNPNPVTLTITHGWHNNAWVSWDDPLFPKEEFGGSQTSTLIIYNDRFEMAGYVFWKQ